MKHIATVVGLGVSGAGAARLLRRKGWEVRVTEGIDTPEVRRRIQELEGIGHIKFEAGRHTRDFIEGSSLVITSPGVKDNAMPLIWARKLGIPVIDEIELGYRFCPCRIVAVTGTNGKSTTTTLIGEIFKAAKKDVIVCGNIGVSFCQEVLRAKRNSVIVLEISSFQLQRTVKFRPYVSLFLNISQNHLDRHKDFKEYLSAKLNIFKNQKKSDWAILNHDDKNLKYLDRHIKSRILYFGGSTALAMALAKGGQTIAPWLIGGQTLPCRQAGMALWPTDADGACLKEGFIYLVRRGKPHKFISVDEIALKGGHNARNAMAAILTAEIFKVPPHVTAAVLRKFKGLEHRWEHVADIDGVKFINDSKATTVDAAMWAIRSFKEPVILIAGGRDKGSDFTVLKSLIEERVKHLILIGEAKAKIRTQLLGSAPIHEVDSLDRAVSLGLHLARKGEAVLLSPMCASFDMFKNFEDRGECFKKAVRSLKKERSGAELCKVQ